MNKQHGLLFKMLCICLATVLMVGSTAVVSFADGETTTCEHPVEKYVYTPNEDGKTHKITCGDCGEEIDQGADHNRKYSDYEGDTHTVSCENCTWKNENVPHDYEPVKIDDNTHCFKCECGKLKVVEGKSEFEHVFSDWAIDETDPTVHTVTCICGFQKSEKHNFDKKDNKDGTHTISCPTCGYKETGFHSGLTVNAKGEHTGKCDVCGQDVTVSGHHFDEDTVKSYASYHEATCVFCSTTLKDAHTFNYIYQGNADAQFHFCTVCGKEGTHVFTKWENKDSVDHYCVKCDGCDLNGKNEKIVAPHDWKEKTIKERTLFKDGEKAQKCWQCGAVQEGSSKEIPSVIKSIGLWIVGAFGFVGHVAYEPIRWIVKLFDDTPPKD